MVNKDCFGYSGNGCSALTNRECDFKKCNFYKSKEQRDEEWKKYPPINYGVYKDTGEIVKLNIK